MKIILTRVPSALTDDITIEFNGCADLTHSPFSFTSDSKVALLICPDYLSESNYGNYPKIHEEDAIKDAVNMMTRTLLPNGRYKYTVYTEHLNYIEIDGVTYRDLDAYEPELDRFLKKQHLQTLKNTPANYFFAKGTFESGKLPVILHADSFGKLLNHLGITAIGDSLAEMVPKFINHLRGTYYPVSYKSFHNGYYVVKQEKEETREAVNHKLLSRMLAHQYQKIEERKIIKEKNPKEAAKILWGQSQKNEK